MSNETSLILAYWRGSVLSARADLRAAQRQMEAAAAQLEEARARAHEAEIADGGRLKTALQLVGPAEQIRMCAERAGDQLSYRCKAGHAFGSIFGRGRRPDSILQAEVAVQLLFHHDKTGCDAEVSRARGGAR